MRRDLSGMGLPLWPPKSHCQHFNEHFQLFCMRFYCVHICGMYYKISLSVYSILTIGYWMFSSSVFIYHLSVPRVWETRCPFVSLLCTYQTSTYTDCIYCGSPVTCIWVPSMCSAVPIVYTFVEHFLNRFITTTLNEDQTSTLLIHQASTVFEDHLCYSTGAHKVWTPAVHILEYLCACWLSAYFVFHHQIKFLKEGPCGLIHP